MRRLYSAFSRYERGVISQSIEATQKVADALNVGVDGLLFYGVDDNEPQIITIGRIGIATPEERENALAEIFCYTSSGSSKLRAGCSTTRPTLRQRLSHEESTAL